MGLDINDDLYTSRPVNLLLHELSSVMSCVIKFESVYECGSGYCLECFLFRNELN
jgi:hypothetical protein